MSAIYDKNLERIRAIEKKVAAGTLDPAKAEKRIATLRKVPDYWVKVYDGPEPVRRHADPPESIRAAEKLEKQLQGEITTGLFVPDQIIKVRIGEVLDAYLEKQVGKGGYAACKSRLKRAERVRFDTLEAWHHDVKRIQRHLDNDTPDNWADKSIWNYAKTLQFAVQLYIDTHQRLNIKNPVRTAIKAMGLEEGTQRREVVPTDFEIAMLAGEARRKAYPSYLAPLLVFLRETGLREIEALSMRWEKVSMDYDPAVEVFPWADVRLRKKKRFIVRRIPLNPKAWQALRLIQAATEGPTETGFIFPVRNFPGKLYRRVRAAVELEGINVHDFRKSWSSEHLHDGAELRKEVRGHDTDEMDEYYLVLTEKDTRQIYANDWKQFERESHAG